VREALSPNWSPWLCRLIPMRHPAHAPRHPLTRHPCPVSHHSVRGDVRRTWLQPVRSARPSPPSPRGDVRRTWLQPVRSARPSPPPARPSLLAVSHHSVRGDVRRTWLQTSRVGSSLASARSSLAPSCVSPLRSGRRSSHMVAAGPVGSSLASTRSSLAPTQQASST